MTTNKNIYFMRQALKCAQQASKKGEVPVGAVIVKDGKIIARGFNKSIKLNDATAHAEIIALRKACKKLKNYRLNGCSIYVTIEPCPMCAGALVLARFKEIYFGAKDVKAGACGTLFNITGNDNLNHKIQVTGGLLGNECAKIITEFFQTKRQRRG